MLENPNLLSNSSGVGLKRLAAVCEFVLHDEFNEHSIPEREHRAPGPWAPG